jgi:hypothetical protein
VSEKLLNPRVRAIASIIVRCKLPLASVLRVSQNLKEARGPSVKRNAKPDDTDNRRTNFEWAWCFRPV